MRLLNHVVHVIILLTVAVAQVRATNRHMICKDVDDVFEERGHPMGPPRNPMFRIGKQGPAGPPGPKGEKGEPGIIDLELLKQQIINEVIEKVLFNITAERESSTSTKAQQEKGDVICQDVNGFIYDDKCYWLTLYSIRNVTFALAESICADGGGEPGDVVDQSHFEMIEEKIQAIMSSSIRRAYVWIGTTINQKTKAVTMRSGKKATYMKWSNGYASPIAGRTGIALQIFPSPSHNGMWNYLPTYSNHGVLCEK